MTRTQLIFLAAFGSFALLAGAFVFQVIGYAPCKMCLWQRWPHVVAITVGVLAVLMARHQRAFAVLGAIAASITAGIGVYHTGVERGIWEGPTSCTGGGALNMADPLSMDIAPIVMCDDVVWSLMGLSMASYNALISLVLVALWVMAARKA
ncbi:disulfide bond formation protein B [Octadecabacter sp. G9-8]|uniref:Disulfide bond formation protein B n=1 Tax=Octadecabacter dasysiphoniae TaxID=2909341 RepID=A0ABS9CTP6_9RHOB|nr:disulfide bond formation protein B [Octadecabacter dasysiphoniae]MCF2870608.1 disulfide bond formation protein B [Octadecabacter dasysiphoniae]